MHARPLGVEHSEGREYGADAGYLLPLRIVGKRMRTDNFQLHAASLKHGVPGMFCKPNERVDASDRHRILDCWMGVIINNFKVLELISGDGRRLSLNY